MQELESAGLDLSQVQAAQEVIAKVDPNREMQKLAKLRIETLIFPEQGYPKLLKELPDAPGLLYIRGKILPEDEIALAVVGSRKFTSYGQRAVEEIVYPLAKNQVTIISGLALGIDAIAHHVALEAKGRTIAVLGCGLDEVYPVNNIRLADKIIASGGAIISEFPLKTASFRSNFPLRNRIIAGMSLGTLVVEGALESGSLITARAAIDYNREVFAVPGMIFSETSQGPNRLIQMGAKLITSSSDILEELDIPKRQGYVKSSEIIPDSREEEILLKLLGKPILVDSLIRQSRLEPALVNSTLVMLEMKGMVANLGGTSYVIKGKLKENPKS
ncbi:MAG: protecting protein DprA protein [Berkelbacteria bacterium GW2011_GWB1_38_5]|uniref:Protecting protein DprA protein n=2 Tax=Candidatus Berkelbacteria TaxID=1618330 RepID=A0A0G0PN40_9BACT|nr:MAG: protecting protein DprA protein [Berkelbacteria bacterium GW2011_GWB1_38_5]KKQ90706.1 MAG: protecting protein DprA protein [Berkelbacteria bacterium GW2011_GWA1_39_10]